MHNIEKIEISEAMKTKYLDYATSVIVGRALPDVRDGLKWVHRRILYSMHELGLAPDKGYRKSARIVGEVLGKFHPHGDSSVYDALVRMAQDFSLRYTLVDGHGNFGSIDGDSAAAYRYTEAKMNKIAVEMLRDINKNTVDFMDNFDGEEQEPVILPSRFPNLLVNGTEGIAVGVATAIPPHNLGEVIDGIIYQIDNPECNTNELIQFIKAPDFPTKATIINPQDMAQIYDKGEGKIIMRAKYHIEAEEKQNKIIITEIPYQVNKAKLLEQIVDLTKDSVKKIKGQDVLVKAKSPDIIDIVDESDREGMRINITLKKNANIDKNLAVLFKNTKLQSDYDANFTVIYGTNELIEHVSLKEINKYYINHQKEVLTRRTRFELTKANKRLHIILGLKKALENIDKTIEIIKTSKNISLAKEKLCLELQIDNIQAQEILNIKLSKLVKLEIEFLIQEYEDLLIYIKGLDNILSTEENLLELLKSELLETKDKYGDKRRTKLEYQENKINTEIIIETEDYNIKYFLTKGQYLKKIPLVNLRNATENKTKENDAFIQELQSTNNSELILLSDLGNAYKTYGNQINDTTSKKLGEYIPSLIELEPNEKIIGMLATSDFKGFAIIVFENGKIAKINLNSFQTQTKRTKLKNSLNLDSPVVSMFQIAEDTDVLLKSNQNKAVIVNTKDVTEKSSRNSQGVTFMKSAKEDFEVTEATIYDNSLDTDYYRVIKSSAGKSLF